MMKRFLLSFVLVFSVLAEVLGQSAKSISGGLISRPVCIASDKIVKSFTPPPDEFLLKSGEQKSDFIIDYVGFPEEAKAALEYAVNIWGSLIESDVPIHVRANWDSSLESNVLANCGPGSYFSDFKDIPFKGLFYPVAIAEKIAGEELNGASRFDIEANFSSKINWYYGIDGDTPSDKYDFVSIALHELAHGLGFQAFFFVNNDLGGYGYYEFGEVSPFDRLIEYLGDQLVNTSIFENPSEEIKTALTSRQLYSNSPVAKSANSGKRPKLYAPLDYNPGSSISHLDENYNYTKNSLMTYSTGRGEAVHDPGPLTMGIMEDIGWTNLIIRHRGVRDKERVEPIRFIASFESYYDLIEGSAKVIYSTDDFISSMDTILMEPVENNGEYVALLEPDRAEDIQYYIEVSDVKGRIRNSPWDAPKDFHNVHFGTDLQYPTITTDDIPYFILKGEPLRIEANVDDNLGVDTVYVNYEINGTVQPSFGLTLAPGTYTNYSGYFNLNLETLADGDVIKYQIVAIDASGNHNTSLYPENTYIEFVVNKIFDPLTSYSNNFNSVSSDFVLSDFDINTADNFTDGALQSPHPYESAGEDNELNLSVLLKYPIIVQEVGEMSFDEVVLVEPGELSSVYGDDDFWDYVIVEGSKDFGESWVSLVDGYDSGDNATWEQEYNKGVPNGEQDSETLGTAELYVNRSISLLESGNFSVGDTILIRFRLYSDPYARGWGWAIDNLIIQQPLAAKETILSPGNVNAYPNPFNNNFEIEVNPKAPLKEMRIELYDMYGRSLLVINRQNVTSYKETIDMQKYSSGLFLLKVIEDGQPVLSKKMIKN